MKPILFVGEARAARLEMSRRELSPVLDHHVRHAARRAEIEASPVGEIVLCAGWGRIMTLADIDRLKARGYTVSNPLPER